MVISVLPPILACWVQLLATVDEDLSPRKRERSCAALAALARDPSRHALSWEML